MHSRLEGSRLRARAGFTLIELLTVIAIIGILAAIIIPTVGKVRVTAKKAQCVARLRQWGNAVGLAANDYKNKVPLFYKNDTVFIYDAYFSAKSMIVDDATRGTASRDLRPTEAMTQCPNGLNGGNGSNRQYAFVVPVGLAAKDARIFGTFTPNYYYGMGDASSPAKLLLMIENDQGGTQVRVQPQSLGDIKTELNTKVVPVQKTTDRIRHGGIANALFLDGHVAGLNISDTDYDNTESKEKLNQWFTLK
jgi:prepilin-type N-terminal cleavage/methylation domain-containing protein/prepilin-type processing-associated H-X9-DG protein